jgi:Kef-type K+ transport system membrane component KefB
MTPFAQIALLMALAAILSIVAHRLRQPLILGYIFAGVIIHATGLLGVVDKHQLELFSQIGIVFLLFILGLELDLRELRTLGFTAMATGIGQIVFTSLFGIIIATALGFSFTAAIYVAIALTFSSTIVVVKLLSQKKHLDTLYGKISVSFLLIQDFVAIILLILISASSKSAGSSAIGLELLLLGVKGFGLLFLVFFITEFALPLIIRITGHDREVLFISMIAWALSFAALAATPLIGFSLEIGALLAGIALSASKESLQIESWTKPLRDFFLVVFFVLLGFNLDVSNISDVILPVAVFSLFVLIGNPIIVMLIMRSLGYSSQTGFFAGLTVAQISEFSLLLASVGLAAGQISTREVTILTLVGGITMTGSSLMINYNEQIYTLLKPLLRVFEPVQLRHGETKGRKTRGKVVVFGFRRLAAGLGGLIDNSDKDFIIIDNDPKVIERAEQFGAETIFGDLTDDDFLRSLKLEQTEIIISTVPDKSANLALLLFARSNDIDVPIVVPAFHDEVALEFYEQGADFVLYPYLFTSQRLANIVNNSDHRNTMRRFANKERRILEARIGHFDSQ